MGRKTYSGSAAETSLNGAITNVATTLTLADGSSYPSPSASAPMVIVVGVGTASEEQILISARSGNNLTVATNGRSWHLGGSGTGLAHSNGDVVRHVLDANSIDEANQHVNDTATDNHTQYLNTTRHDVTARHAFGAAYGTPGTPAAPATSGAAGSATGPPHSDHVHPAYNHFVQRASVATQQLLTGSAADVTGLSVTFNATLGRWYKVEAWVWADTSGVGDVFGFLMEGATQLNANDLRNSTASAFAGYFVIPYQSNAISTGSHTYKVQASKSGAGTYYANSTNQPSFITVEDIGS